MLIPEAHAGGKTNEEEAVLGGDLKESLGVSIATIGNEERASGIKGRIKAFSDVLGGDAKGMKGRRGKVRK